MYKYYYPKLFLPNFSLSILPNPKLQLPNNMAIVQSTFAFEFPPPLFQPEFCIPPASPCFHTNNLNTKVSLSSMFDSKYAIISTRGFRIPTWTALILFFTLEMVWFSVHGFYTVSQAVKNLK